MKNQLTILITIFFISSLNVGWCDHGNHAINFAAIASHKQLSNFNVTAVNESVTDSAIRIILGDMANGKLAKDDRVLIELIKNSIVEASTQYRKIENNRKALIKAGANKAQNIVTDVTAAYTQAIFKAQSPIEARQILSRFQETIQLIVDFTKNGRFVTFVDAKSTN